MQPKILQLFSVVAMVCLYFITPTQALHSSYYNQYIKVDISPDNAYGINGLITQAQEDGSIQKYVQQYTVAGKHATERLLGKGAYYFPIFEFYLSKKGLPDALKYLPAVESHLYPEVKSNRGAAGLWQFMPATARYYGLQVDEQVDERYDPHLASEAAAAMLSDLYQQFGDWPLVLAAYNCGPGRLRKAMRKANSKQYEDIKAFLPKQTQQYTDKITAFLFVAQNHEALGIQANISASIQEKLMQSVQFQGKHDLKQLAKAAQMDVAYLEALNPQYQTTSLKAFQSHELQVPDYAKVLLDNYFEQRQTPDIEIIELRFPQVQLSTHLCFFENIPNSIDAASTPEPDTHRPANNQAWAVLRKSTVWT